MAAGNILGRIARERARSENVRLEVSSMLIE